MQETTFREAQIPEVESESISDSDLSEAEGYLILWVCGRSALSPSLNLPFPRARARGDPTISDN